MPKFSKASKANLAQAHPLLQKLFNQVILDFDCTILDAQRGRAAQEKAFRGNFSKAHYGESPHNFAPAIALDVVPYPLDWDDIARFKAQADLVKRVASALGIPIAWGGDWISIKDYDHFELNPWKVWAAKAKPYLGND